MMNSSERAQLPSSKLSSFLGAFSIALGAAELVMPDFVANAAGLAPDSRTTLRLYGMREILSGIGVLSPSPSGRSVGLWSRVVGDALDLALLMRHMARDSGDSSRLAFSSAAVLGITALDLRAALQEPAPAPMPRYGAIRRTIARYLPERAHFMRSQPAA